MRRRRIGWLLMGVVAAFATLSFAVAQRAEKTPHVYATFSTNSPNGKFRVTLEQTSEEARSGDVAITARLFAVGFLNRELWHKDFEGAALEFQPDLKVANDGRSFVVERDIYEWTLMTEQFEKTIATIDRDELSYFNSREQKLIAFDELDGKKIVRVWNRNPDEWKAFSAQTGDPIPVTADSTRKWNEATRASILEHPKQMDEIEAEFLAVRRNPDDRKLLEELLNPGKQNQRTIPWGFESPFGFVSDRYQHHFTATDSTRVAVDHLLAVFDGKAAKTFSYAKKMEDSLSSVPSFSDPKPLHYLGAVSGVVEFSTPLRDLIGAFRIALVPDTRDGWENRPGVEWLEFTGELNAYRDYSAKASFNFSTVKPGTYFAKAVWDKTAPFTDRAKAGVGDYESNFIGPITVTAGVSTTNVTLVCTNRVGANSAYANDDEATLAWQRGDLTPSHMRGDVFSAGAARWIVGTNNVSADNPAWISWISLNSRCLCPGERMARPDALVVYARDADGDRANHIDQLRIIDAHGCVYKSRANLDQRLTEFRFETFPRAEQTFRLIGSDANKHDVLDLTITNLVRVERQAIAPSTLPMEIDVEAVPVKILGISATPDDINAEMAFEIPNAGDADYQVGGFFIDSTGNWVNPAEMCREETALRVVCNLWRKRPNPRLIPFEIAVERASVRIPAQPAGPSSSGASVFK